MKLPQLMAISPQGLSDLLAAQNMSAIPKLWETAKNFVNAAPTVADVIIGEDMTGEKKKGGKTYGVRLIDMAGPMMKRAGFWESYFFGAIGTADVAEMIKAADNDTEVDAIVLRIDSPGGAVDGTEMLADAVANAKKPIVAYVDGMAASAAYWVASQASKIVAGGNTSIIGSIGTLYVHTSAQAYYNELGVKFTYVTADASPDKAKVNATTDLDEQGVAQLKDMLNPINNTFLGSVKSKRKIDESALTGKIYTAEQAAGLGLIDEIGTLQSAVSAAVKLATTKTNSNNKTKMEEKFEQLLSKLEAKIATISEKIEAISVAKEATEKELADLKAENETLKARPLTQPVAVATAETKNIDAEDTWSAPWNAQLKQILGK